jgi:hypothetical protein
MLELLLILGGAAVVGSGLMLLRRRKKQDGRAEAAKPRDRTPMTIRTGDIVGYMGSDYVVKARLVFDEEGFRWYVHELEDGPRQRVLVCSLDDRLRLYFLEPDAQLTATVGEMPGDSIEVGMARYRLTDRGAAKVTREGNAAPPEDARYWEFQGPGGKIAWACRRGGRMQVCVGDEIRVDTMLELYPGAEG